MAKKQHKQSATIDPGTLDTYFKQRMHAMGITDTGKYGYEIESLEYHGQKSFQPLFTEDDRGNIIIHYPALRGGPEVIDDTEIPFTRKRFHPDNQPDPEVKYIQEKGSGIHIFFPQVIIDKFAKKEHIETLFLVEGEFKAFAGALKGLDICGLGGKDNFRDNDKKNIHPDIAALVRDCTVTNLVLLLDADTLQIKWDPANDEDKDKDLARRLYFFSNTVINFREVAKANLGLKDCYFSHLKLNNLPDAKGLDDLLEQKQREGIDHTFVTNDMHKLAASKVYFDTYNIGAMTPAAINGIFYLNFHRGVPSKFYANYQDILRDHEFKFSNAIFKFSVDEGLKVIKQADSDKYIRVGCDYYKMIEIPDPNGALQPSLVGWSPTEIKRDYGNGFFQQIDRYDSFCNVPCNTAEFAKVVNGCYNLYYPLTHTLEEGKWPTIERFLKHCFGERTLQSGHTTHDLILDYISILYRHPTQMLPIGVLYSKENNTGKSTFLWLLEAIFMSNYTELTGDMLDDTFNEDWATRLVGGLDEGFIEKNKVYQKIKSMSTAHSIMLRAMHVGRKKVPFFLKFWFSTNDIAFIRLEQMDSRWWITEVPVLKDVDPDILQKMTIEVPYFLYHIANRDIKHPRVSRHWFAPNLLQTEISNRMKERSKGWFEKEITSILEVEFFEYCWHTLYFTHDELMEKLNGRNSAAKFRSADIREQLRDIFHLETSLQRWKHPNKPSATDTEYTPRVSEKHRNCYEFRIEQFLPPDKIRQLHEYFDYDLILQERANPVVLSDVMPF